MAYKLLNVGNSSNTPRKEFIFDNETDLNNFPKDQYSFGDLAFVIEPEQGGYGYYAISDSEKEWVKLSQ